MRVLIALLLVTGGLALAGCGGSSSSSTTTTAPPPTTTTAPPPTTTAPPPTTTTTPTTTAAPKVQVIRIVVNGGKPVGGITRASVKKGEKVALVVRSDVADEIHLHGYDKSVDVAAGGTARLPFVANIPGVFEAELENRSLQILQLTVQ